MIYCYEWNDTINNHESVPLLPLTYEYPITFINIYLIVYSFFMELKLNLNELRYSNYCSLILDVLSLSVATE